MSPQLGFSTCSATPRTGGVAFIKDPIDVLFQLLVLFTQNGTAGSTAKQRRRSLTAEETQRLPASLRSRKR